MMQIAATSAKNRFGEMLDTCQREPVVIEKSGRAHSVVISIVEYKRLLERESIASSLQISTKKSSKQGTIFYAEFKDWVDWNNQKFAEHGIFGEEHRVW